MRSVDKTIKIYQFIWLTNYVNIYQSIKLISRRIIPTIFFEEKGKRAHLLTIY